MVPIPRNGESVFQFRKTVGHFNSLSHIMEGFDKKHRKILPIRRKTPSNSSIDTKKPCNAIHAHNGLSSSKATTNLPWY